MRRRPQRQLRSCVVALALAAVACGDSGGGDAAAGDDGAGGSGGLSRMPTSANPRTEGNRASQADCAEFATCGGDPEGAWSITSICLFEADELLGSVVLEPACADQLQDVTVYSAGSYQFEPGMEDMPGTLLQDVVFAVDLDVRWDPDCIAAVGGGSASEGVCEAFQDDYLMDPGLIDASCELDGDACTCLLMAEDRTLSGDAQYAVNGDQLDIGNGPQDFCIDGDEMQVRVTAAGLDGVLTFRRM